MTSFRSPLSLFVLLSFIATSVLVCVPQRAHAQSVAFNAHASSFGPGGAITVKLHSEVNVRGGASYLPLTHSGTLKQEVDVKYDVTGRLAAVTVFLDWHPFNNAFRVSTGAVYDRSSATSNAQPTESYTMQGKTFSPDKLGEINADISFANTIHPYLGIGLGNAVRGSRLDVFFDLGAMYVNQPEVDMEGTGLISATANNESSLNEGLKSFRILPYLSLGMSLSL